MRNLFNQENRLFCILGKMADGLFLNLLWILFSLPLVTAGASAAALYDTVRKTLRQERGYIWSNFLGAFQSNFKKATKLWLLLLGIFAFLCLDFWITFRLLKQGAAAGVLCYFFLFMMLLEAVWSVYLFALLVRSESGVWQTMKNAAVMGIVHSKGSFFIMVVWAAGTLSAFLVPVFSLAVPVSSVYLFDVIIDRIQIQHTNVK